MSRSAIILNSKDSREKVAKLALSLPDGTMVEFKKKRRTLNQNSKLWAMLSDLSQQLPWHGQRLTPEDYKLIFLDALRREMNEQMRIVPNLDGNGFVALGKSSSALTISEMADLITLIQAFGASHGVTFHDREAA